MINIFKKEGLKRKCNRYLAKHQYEKVLQLTPKAIADFPKDPQFYIYTLWALSELKHLDQALEEADKALQIFENHLVLLNLKGEICFKKGQFDDAIACLEYVHQTTPDNLHTCYILGQVYTAKGDLDTASRYFEPILQYDPKLLQVRMLAMSERFIFEMNQKQVL